MSTKGSSKNVADQVSQSIHASTKLNREANFSQIQRTKKTYVILSSTNGL